MTNLMQASRQWASRSADERYASLLDMQSYMTRRRDRSRATVESTRALTVMPDQSDPGHRGLFLGIERGPLAGQQLAPTHQAFGQICSLAATPSPASYFRESRLPAPIIADALNHNLRFTRDVENVGVLATMGDEDNGLGVPAGSELRAATGPAYGRIWDADIVDALVERFGDGVSGHWRVPGEFGNRITVTKENTTLFASDRDMFVFLADEDRRIDIPDRRNGSGGSIARGFFVWNSEVGDKTLGLGFFLFDYVCCNRVGPALRPVPHYPSRIVSRKADRDLPGDLHGRYLQIVRCLCRAARGRDRLFRRMGPGGWSRRLPSLARSPSARAGHSASAGRWPRSSPPRGP